MYSSNNIADNIRLKSNEKGITISKMLSDIGLGRNVMSHLDNGSMIKADSLAKIADYLEVSVDYLLGRTEEPYIEKISNSNIGAIGNKSTGSITINNNSGLSSDVLMKVDETSLQLLEAFTNLNFIDKAKVMNLVSELMQNK
ncbi:MAG: helix-turn-helix domain-containing protein [Treponema sp.]